jgi:phosphatidylserine decarboxylase
MPTLSFGERMVRSAWRIMPQRALSDVIGWGATRPLPRPVRERFLRSFAGRFGIDVSEAEKPIEEYGGLQEFFTRRLRPGARPIDSRPGIVVGPADGTMVEQGLVTEGKLIAAKESVFTLAELLADREAAADLEGGAYQITYLSPKDYHRVHTPVAGGVLRWHHVPGYLFPVNRRSAIREPGLFGMNERFVSILDGEFGLCAVVMVAAVGVGHVTASYDPEVATHDEAFSRGDARHKPFDPPLALARGQELGIFHLGSTAIIVFEKGRVTLNDTPPGSIARVGAPIGSTEGGA